MTSPEQITIAVAKGYLMTEAVKLLAQIGITFEESPEDSRKLYRYDTSGAIKLLLIRPWDVPEYVEQGAADLGIVGEDVLFEKQSQVIRLVDMHYGGCSLVIAGTSDVQQKGLRHDMVVATKYPNSCRDYFLNKGLKVRMIKLYGAIELAPLTGLADVICDLTATGQTLKEHQLEIIDTVFSSTANLIANKKSYRFHHQRIRNLVNQLKTVIQP